jgi:hypothetical protein
MFGRTGEDCPLANLGIRMKSLTAKGAKRGFGRLSTLTSKWNPGGARPVCSGRLLLAHGVGGDSVAKFDGFDGDGSAQGNNLPPKPV